MIINVLILIFVELKIQRPQHLQQADVQIFSRDKKNSMTPLRTAEDKPAKQKSISEDEKKREQGIKKL